MEKTNSDAEHIVKSYDDELQRLGALIVRMGGLAESQLASAIQSVVQRNSDLAQQVIEADLQVDNLEDSIGNFTTRLFALRQPMAVDLRFILASLKISADIERIGDYAKNVAKRAIVLNQHPQAEVVHGVRRMGTIVQGMIKEVLDAYIERDLPMAMAVWQRDHEVDQLYNSLFRELLTYMMEDPRTITAGTHLMFMAKNIERIGDLTTNVAENVYYIVKGTHLDAARPKGDDTSLLLGPETPPVSTGTEVGSSS
tara:strand:+ start:246 stop:1010 length:765 start_codon:yes stop_codon:yes gene_type:complete